jgi:hypothetical protein
LAKLSLRINDIWIENQRSSRKRDMLSDVLF